MRLRQKGSEAAQKKNKEKKTLTRGQGSVILTGMWSWTCRVEARQSVGAPWTARRDVGGSKTTIAWWGQSKARSDSAALQGARRACVSTGWGFSGHRVIKKLLVKKKLFDRIKFINSSTHTRLTIQGHQ